MTDQDYLQNADACMQHLCEVANSPELDHNISIVIDNKSYAFYDLAAFVSSLWEALDYFKSEIR